MLSSTGGSVSLIVGHVSWKLITRDVMIWIVSCINLLIEMKKVEEKNER